jgi:hypothetical protein
VLDLNGDCRLDMLDVKEFLAEWLTCGREPAGECWQ